MMYQIDRFGKYLIGTMIVMALSCSSSVEINYFSMGNLPNVTVKKVHSIDQPVGVENFTSSSQIRRHEIILRYQGDHRISVSSHNLWWALPEEMITDSFKNYLMASGIFSQVLSYPSSHSIRYIMEGSIKYFEIRMYEQHWESYVALTLYLVDRKEEKILWESGTLESSRKSLPEFEDAARQMSAALEDIWQKNDHSLKSVVAKFGR